MATGDVQGNVDRLRLELRSVRYNAEFDIQGLQEGNPAAFLPLLHYSLLGYSRLLARHLSGLGYELYAKSDLRFVESVFKILRDEFAYRSSLTVAQFLSRGFAERKLILLYDVVQLCKRKHNELWKESQPARMHKQVHKTPPADEGEPAVRVVRETPPAAPASASNQATRPTSSGREASANNRTADAGGDAGSTSKVAALAARFRSPTEPPPLPKALQKQRRRVIRPSNFIPQASQNPAPPVMPTNPQNGTPKPQSAGPSNQRPSVRATVNFQNVPLPVDPGRSQVDYSNRPMSEILRQFGGTRNGANRPQPPPAGGVERLRAENSFENGGSSDRWRVDRGKSLLDGPDEVFEDRDEDRKEMSGVEPAQLLAALRRQFDSSGNLVEAERRFGRQDDLTRTSVSSDEDGPLSSEKLRQLAEKNSEQVEEVRSMVTSLEGKYSKMEEEALKIKENLQAKITLLEGRIRFLEHAQAEKKNGTSVASPQQKAGPSYAGRPLSARPLRQTSLPRRATSQAQPVAPPVQRSIEDVTNTENSPNIQVQVPEVSPIKANRGTKDFIEKMRARFEATQELLRESDKVSTLR